MKRCTWAMTSGILLLTVLCGLRNFESSRISSPLEIHYKNGSTEKAVDFISGDYSPKTDFFSVTGVISQKFYSRAVFGFWVDDCLEALTLNGLTVPLDHLTSQERCDLIHGITLDLGPFLHTGQNGLEAKVKNSSGGYRFGAIRIQSPMGQWVALLGAVLSFCLIFSRVFDWACKENGQRISPRMKLVLALLIVGSTGYFSILHRVGHPALGYWDENYYVTDAQKYLSGTHFMQIHPPLGKLVIAIGAKLFGSGTVYPEMLRAEHVGEFPVGFDYFSYRILPALFAYLSLVAFFGAVFVLTGSWAASTAFGLVYALENSMLVHFRGAMLDGTFQFFCMMSVFLGLTLKKRLNEKDRGFPLLLCSSLGSMIGAACAVKYSGAFLLVLLPFVCGTRWRQACVSIAAACGIFLTVWQIHFSLAHRFEPSLRDHGHYSASSRVIEAISAGKPVWPLYLENLRDNLAYFSIYNQGVPLLNFAKPDENGSPALIWPFGAKGINYRWDQNGPRASYLQLQANPVVYLLGLLGLLLGLGYILSPLFVTVGISHELRAQVALLGALYASYMTPLLATSRVLFLYSYFPALAISLLLLAACLPAVKALQGENGARRLAKLSCSFAVCAGVVFFYFSPLTYHYPMTEPDVMARSWLKLWDLHCAECARVFPWLGH